MNKLNECQGKGCNTFLKLKSETHCWKCRKKDRTVCPDRKKRKQYGFDPDAPFGASKEWQSRKLVG